MPYRVWSTPREKAMNVEHVDDCSKYYDDESAQIMRKRQTVQRFEKKERRG